VRRKRDNHHSSTPQADSAVWADAPAWTIPRLAAAPRSRRGRAGAAYTTRRQVVVGLLAGLSALVGCARGTAGSSSGSTESWPIARPAQGAWPSVFWRAPPETQLAYRYALANRHILDFIPCYCGCGVNGHRSNADCYVHAVRGDVVELDTHGFG
jgi:hypothetical protein